VQWGKLDQLPPIKAVRPALLKFKPAGTQIAIAAFTATADPSQKNNSTSLTTKKNQIFSAKPFIIKFTSKFK